MVNQRKISNLSKKFINLMLIVFLLLVLTIPVCAYTFSTNNVKYNDPLTVSVYISSNIPYLSSVTLAYDNWDYLSELDTYRSYDLDYTEAYIIYSSVNNGTYASVSPIGSSDWKQMTIRPAWKDLTSTERQETIAHEMGHCWGLGHGDTDSLMRALGFNNDPYPKDDDEDGIHALY